MEKISHIKFKDCDNSPAPLLVFDNSPALMDSFDSIGIVKAEIAGNYAYLSIGQCENLVSFLQRIIKNEED
jgi:hypothetical protein